MESCLQEIQLSVTIDMNHKLRADFSEIEIKTARFQMKPMGAPGPDGFLTQFY